MTHSVTNRPLRIALHVLMLFMLAHAATGAWGQGYPERPVRLVITGSPGSGGDTLARLIAGGLTETLGQQVIVDNRPGGASNIGAEIAARAAQDGYTIFYAAQSHAVNVTLFRKLSYDLVRDFEPVTLLAKDPAALTVTPSLPVRSVEEFVSYAKARPGKLNYGSGGLASFTFMSTETFKSRAGIDLLHVAYKGGGPALAAVMSGEVSVMFTPIGSGLPHIRQGRLRALGVTTAERLPLLPAIPTVAESGYPGFESTSWFGLVVPAGTPKAVIAKIQTAAVAALNRPDLNAKLKDLAYIVVGSRPEEMAVHMNLEIERLGKIVRALNLTVD